ACSRSITACSTVTPTVPARSASSAPSRCAGCPVPPTHATAPARLPTARAALPHPARAADTDARRDVSCPTPETSRRTRSSSARSPRPPDRRPSPAPSSGRCFRRGWDPSGCPAGPARSHASESARRLPPAPHGRTASRHARGAWRDSPPTPRRPRIGTPPSSAHLRQRDQLDPVTPPDHRRLDDVVGAPLVDEPSHLRHVHQFGIHVRPVPHLPSGIRTRRELTELVPLARAHVLFLHPHRRQRRPTARREAARSRALRQLLHRYRAIPRARLQWDAATLEQVALCHVRTPDRAATGTAPESAPGSGCTHAPIRSAVCTVRRSPAAARA